MLEALAIAALSIAAANVLFVAVLIWRRVVAARRERERIERERRVTPLVHRLIDGDDIGVELSSRDQVAIAGVLARFSRLVKGDAQANIGRYFAGSRAYAAAVEALSSRRAWRRAAAAFELGDMAVAAAAPALIAALDDRDRDVRAAAARSLGRLGSIEATGPLVRHLADGSLPRLVVGSALVALGSAAREGVRPLALHPDATVRTAAVELIGLIGTPADCDVLEQAMHDGDPRVRVCAANALGRVGGRGAATAVVEGLADPEPSVRAAAAATLGAIGDRSALDAVLEIARGSAFEAARAAAYAAGTLDPEAVAAAADDGPHLREVADLLAL